MGDDGIPADRGAEDRAASTGPRRRAGSHSCCPWWCHQTLQLVVGEDVGLLLGVTAPARFLHRVRLQIPVPVRGWPEFCHHDHLAGRTAGSDHLQHRSVAATGMGEPEEAVTEQPPGVPVVEERWLAGWEFDGTDDARRRRGHPLPRSLPTRGPLNRVVSGQASSRDRRGASRQNGGACSYAAVERFVDVGPAVRLWVEESGRVAAAARHRRERRGAHLVR